MSGLSSASRHSSTISGGPSTSSASTPSWRPFEHETKVIGGAFPAGITCVDTPGVTPSDYLDQNGQNAPRRVSRSLLRDCELFSHGLLDFCTMPKGRFGSEAEALPQSTG